MTGASHEPPSFALRLLANLLDDDARDVIIGDLSEAWTREVAERGAPAARRWFWRETAAALWHFRKLPTLTRQHHQESLMSSFAGDVRYAARVLERAPAFTILCTVTLALAIGATSAIYSVVAPVLIRPLPYPTADRLLVVSGSDANGERENLGYATIADLRAQSRTLDGLAAIVGWSTILSSSTDPEQLIGDRVSWNYFDLLGVKMAHGRGFAADEDRPGHNQVVVLSHALWQRRFGSDSTIVGQTIMLDDKPHTVVGVAPADFDNVISPAAQIWRVLGYDTSLPFACRGCRHVHTLGRLKPGATRPQAIAELNAISARLVAEYPRDYANARLYVDRLQDQIAAPMRPALVAIFGAVVLVLLIGAANVVNLQLARAIRRDGEFSVRLALGAGRGRLVQQLVAEGMLLAVLGGLAGLLVARVTLPALVSRLPGDFPRVAAMRLDAWAIGIVGAIVLLLAMVIGVAPVLSRQTRNVFGAALRGGGHVGGATHHRLRRALVIGEIALALLLLAGAGLVARSLERLFNVDAGFDPSHVVTLRLQSTGNAYRDDSSIYEYHRRAIAAARTVPGVIDAAITNQLPLSGDLDMYGVAAQDKPVANPSAEPFGDRYTVSPDFMRAMGIRVLKGRGFDAADGAATVPPVAIVSRGLAAKIWPGEDPLGKRIQIGSPKRPWRTIVGVTADIRHHGLDSTAGEQFYVPEGQWPGADDQAALVVRTRVSPEPIAPAIRHAVAAVDPSQPILSVRTMDALVRASTQQRQLALTLFAAFSALALVLAAAGIYGVLAGSIAERTREIGLRSALGATPAALLSLVLRAGMTMAVFGIVAGLAGALLLMRFIRTLLFGVGTSDPVALAAASIILLLVALAACIVPARRAIRIDPIAALRSE
jgi:putative ABC transport system permease protein